MVAQPEGVGREIFAAATRAFAPVAKVRRTDDGQTRVVLQAGRLAVRRPGWLDVSQGDAFQPYLRRIGGGADAANEHVASAIPWTFLVVQEAPSERSADGGLAAEIKTGGRSPLSTRLRGGTEVLAIAARAAPIATILTIISNDAQARPLAGYDVRLHVEGEVPLGELGHGGTWVGATDEAGRVVLPALEFNFATLLVHQGERLVAQLPLVPGASSRLVIQLPDDGAGLAAQAASRALQDELTDSVVRRTMQIALVRRSIELGDLGRARMEFQNLRELPRRDEFDRRIADQRRRLSALDPNARPLVEEQLDRMTVVARDRLGPAEIDSLQAELEAAEVR
jgi:hypothetical protein